MTTVSEGRQEAGQFPPDAAAAPQGQARTCASSVTPPASVAFDMVTQGARAIRRGATAAASSAAAGAARKGSLADAQPKTFRQSRDWHHQCAARYEVLLLPRLVWGYGHLLVVKPALNFAEWLTESPLRWFVALAVMAVIWFGS